MKYQISLDDSLKFCPVCKDKDNQIKENELKNIHQIIDNIYIEIENPKKHYLQTCRACNISYKSDFPSIKTESFLTNIWNSNSSSRYQDKPSWKLKKIRNMEYVTREKKVYLIYFILIFIIIYSYPEIYLT